MILIGTVRNTSAKIGHMFNCGEVIALAFLGSFIINSVQVCCQAPPELSSFGRHLLVLFYEQKKTLQFKDGELPNGSNTHAMT